MPLSGNPTPKRDSHEQTTWEKFFPYYAGFPKRLRTKFWKA
ncbi:hypothetical protein ACVMB0_001557 [Bradyrhizobium sp. USDA 4451]